VPALPAAAGPQAPAIQRGPLRRGSLSLQRQLARVRWFSKDGVSAHSCRALLERDPGPMRFGADAAASAGAGRRAGHLKWGHWFRLHAGQDPCGGWSGATGTARFRGFLTQLAGGRPARQTWEAPCHRGGTPRRTVSSRSVPRPSSENAPARFPNQQGDVIERGDPTLPQPGHQVVLGSSRRVVAHRGGAAPLDQDHRPPLSSRYSRSKRRRSRLIA
jgi:hypothetical protein